MDKSDNFKMIEGITELLVFMNYLTSRYIIVGDLSKEEIFGVLDKFFVIQNIEKSLLKHL